MSSKRKRGKKRQQKAPPQSPGSQRRLVLVVAALVLLAGGLFALYSLYGARDARDKPWNLILVSIDTLRADHLSCYGSDDVSTPYLDRLASEGVLFEQVQTAAPTTLPAHTSLFTGRTPLRHEVRDNIGFYLDESIPTLASHLNQSGYRTGGFVGAFVLDSRFGLARGFDTYYDDFDSEPESVAGGIVVQRRGEEVLQRAIEWMEKDAVPSPERAPFFTFLHFYDPHTPYDPPVPFQPQEDTGAARYRGEVAYVDSLVGRLLSWLSSRELDENTVIAVVSDHGEALGAHGERTHGFFLYDATLRVPWILRFPEVPGGTRVTGLARIVDVAPTLVDLLSLPPLEGTDGESLVARIENPRQPSKLSAYAETYVPRFGYGWSELRSHRRGKYKLVLAPRSELYDLEQDPGEEHDVSAEQPDIAQALRRELESLLAEGQDDITSGSMDAAAMERLRSLGYVGGGSVSADVSFLELADPKDRLDIYEKLNDPKLSAAGPEDPAALDQAIGHLRDIIEDEPSIPFAHSLYGELLLKAGRSSEAEAVFEGLVETSAFTFTALYGLALAELELGKLDDAEDHFLRAIELEPKSTKSYLRLAEISSARGNLAEAEAWLQKGIDIHPDRRLREELAEVLLYTGRPDEAVSVLTELSETGAIDALASYNLGQALLATGDIEGALEKLADAARRAPGDADVHQALGNALARAGEREAAVDEFRRAVEITPCFVSAHSNMGSALVQLGRLDEAISSYERALSCDPDYGPAYRNLASVYVQQRKLDPAIDALRSAVRLMPENRELKALLDDLIAARQPP